MHAQWCRSCYRSDSLGQITAYLCERGRCHCICLHSPSSLPVHTGSYGRPVVVAGIPEPDGLTFHNQQPDDYEGEEPE